MPRSARHGFPAGTHEDTALLAVVVLTFKIGKLPLPPLDDLLLVVLRRGGAEDCRTTGSATGSADRISRKWRFAARSKLGPGWTALSSKPYVTELASGTKSGGGSTKSGFSTEVRRHAPRLLEPLRKGLAKHPQRQIGTIVP